MCSDLSAAWRGLVKQVATSWLDDYVPSMGVALASDAPDTVRHEYAFKQGTA